MFKGHTRKQGTGKQLGKCPKCAGTRTIGFGWDITDNQRYVEALTLLASLKFGKLYACRRCRAQWYLGENRAMASLVEPDQEQRVQVWSSRPLRPSTKMLRVLRTIGGTPPNGAHEALGVSIPCKCVMKNGEVVDFCLIDFGHDPSLTYKRVRFVDEVESIQVSQHALPPDVRVASYDASEISMSFAPTLLVAPNGQKFIVNWATAFFDAEGVKGEELRLGREPIDRNHLPPVYSNNLDKITVILCDWESRDAELRLPA